MRRAAGLTLVELLAAMAIMALMAALSWRALDGMARAQGAMDSQADEVLSLQAGLTQWGADLDALALLPQTTPLAWDGRVARILRRDVARPEAGVRVVAWTQRQGQWLRWQSRPLATKGDVDAAWEQAQAWSRIPRSAQALHDVSVTPLQAWELLFFQGGSWRDPLPGGAGQPAPADSAAGGALLPDGVRLVLVLPPGQSLSGRIVRDWASPKLSAGKS